MLVVSVHSTVLRTEWINIAKALRNVLPAQVPFYCCLSLTYADLPGGGLKPQTMTESRWGRNLGSHLLSSILESSLWNLGRVIWPLLEHTEKKSVPSLDIWKNALKKPVPSPDIWKASLVLSWVCFCLLWLLLSLLESETTRLLTSL